MDNNVNELILTIFRDASRDIAALKEFYERSAKSIAKLKIEFDDKHKYGAKIADLLDGVLDKKTVDERQKQIELIEEEVLYEDVKLKAICRLYFDKTSNALLYQLEKGKRKEFSPNLARQKQSNIQKNEHILVNSVLSNIVVIFESYLSQIYRLLLSDNPLKYLEGQTIPIAQLFSDTKQILEDKIDSEVEAKLYNSLDFLNTLQHKEKILIERYEKIIGDFAEVYYRRNAYIHTDGRANKKYLASVSPEIAKLFNEGEMLVCDDIYIDHAICVLTKLLFAITYELLSIRNADCKLMSRLGDYLFKRLSEKEYELCKLGYYALSKYQNFDFAEKTLYRINYILALQNLDEQELAKKELEKMDLSIAQDNYKIAKCCLLNNNEEVFNLLKETYPTSFNAIAIKTWPIFINFRETKYYSEFVKLHSEDFESEEIDFDDELF